MTGFRGELLVRGDLLGFDGFMALLDGGVWIFLRVDPSGWPYRDKAAAEEDG